MWLVYYLPLWFFVFLISLDYSCSQGQYEGESCQANNEAGLCIPMGKCPRAIENLRKGIRPTVCSFSGQEAIVCCQGSTGTTTSKPYLTTRTTTRKPSQSIPEDYDYKEEDSSNACPPIPSNATSLKKIGRKYYDKCIDYLDLIYPCVSAPTLLLNSEKIRPNRCGHTAVELILGGQATTEREFPHMALLGYGDTVEKAEWQCGGTLISEQYIMTAGHCTFSRDLGDVKYVRLGVLKVSTKSEASRVFQVASIIQHPNYKPPTKYNDLALLKLDRKVVFDQWVRPACLHGGENVDDNKVIATGWGVTKYRGQTADTLQKVTLEKFTTEECRLRIPADRKMTQGILEESQLCAGSHTEEKDTCQGDSGGPIQIYHKQVDCQYIVVGVTSFGKACGFVGVPGVYTRVSQFLPWIESIAWS